MMKNTKKTGYAAITTAALLAGVTIPSVVAHADTNVSYGKQDFYVQHVGTYDSGAAFDEGGTEIVTYDEETERIFSVNGDAKAVDIIDASGLEGYKGEVEKMPLIDRIQLGERSEELTAVDDITSIALHPSGEYLAVAVPANPKTDNGFVVFMNKSGDYLSHVEVGSLPDMVTFTPDGTRALVANEGEPNDAYTVNPEGSVGIIDLTGDVNALTNNHVKIVGFDGAEIEESIRKTNPDVSYQQDFEPEYITVDEDGKYAYVVLQESNAMATLNLETERFEQVADLGFKDHSLAENALDTSNEDDGINLGTYPILGMYQPDGITSFSANGKTYIVTPNEGDAVDYDGYSEETEVAEIQDQYALNADHFASFTQEEVDQMVENGLFSKEQTGELGTTTAAPMNEDGNYEAIYKFGARSFSIWDAEDMSLVYDSGNEFADVTANALPEYFNTSNDVDEMDDRSDNKGTEPETVVTGMVGDKHYAFIGLERIGGIMVYDITSPKKASFVHYFSSRDFSQEEPAGDIAPEGLKFVEADASPTGNPMLIAGFEVSGTIGVYDFPESMDRHNSVDEEKEDMDERNLEEYDTVTVGFGDTLYGIALEHDTSWKELQELNNLDNPTLIFPGQKLLLPPK